MARWRRATSETVSVLLFAQGDQQIFRTTGIRIDWRRVETDCPRLIEHLFVVSITGIKHARFSETIDGMLFEVMTYENMPARVIRQVVKGIIKQCVSSI